MKPWDRYPADYRQVEIGLITQAVRAGECVSLVGLSGSGKSNLLGVLSRRLEAPQPMLVDCNRLGQPLPALLYRQVRHQLGETDPAGDEFLALEAVLERYMASASEGLCLILDRFDVFLDHPDPILFNNLRVLRDNHKYHLTLVLTTRRPLPVDNELAELFFAHTLWLGALSAEDACWSVSSYAERHGLSWDKSTVEKIIAITGGYPAFLRAACEAFASGVALIMADLLAAPAVKARLSEFMTDLPGDQDLSRAGLAGIPLLCLEQAKGPLDEYELPMQAGTSLTVMEQRLLDVLRAQTNQLCSKDDLIRAVWTEDRIFMQGVRDDSLAQLVRRLREKIETDPSNPRHILTSPGRGYYYRK